MRSRKGIRMSSGFDARRRSSKKRKSRSVTLASRGLFQPSFKFPVPTLRVFLADAVYGRSEHTKRTQGRKRAEGISACRFSLRYVLILCQINTRRGESRLTDRIHRPRPSPQPHAPSTYRPFRGFGTAGAGLTNFESSRGVFGVTLVNSVVDWPSTQVETRWKGTFTPATSR